MAYYNFNRGIPSGDNTAIRKIGDMTSNNFHGTHNNFSLTGNTSNFVSTKDVSTSLSTIDYIKDFDNLPVKVAVTNNDFQEVSGFDLTYILNGNTVSETFTDTIAAHQTAIYTFTQHANATPQNFYNVMVDADLQYDANTDNDSDTLLINANTQSNVLAFDGVDDFVLIEDNDSLDLTNNYTLEAWVKFNGFEWLDGIISKYNTAASSSANGYILRLTPDAPYTGIDFDGMKTTTGIVDTTQWYHIAAVNDNGTRHLYLNGVEQTITGTPLNVVPNTDPLCIGIDFLEDSIRYFNGKIDEVRIWNDVRTQQEITDNMYTEIDTASTNLVVYYDFNRGISAGDNTTIEHLPDMTSNNLHGTLQNFALTNDDTTSNFVGDCNLDFEAPVTPTLADLTGECSVTATAPTTTDNCAGTLTGTTSDPTEYTAQGTYTINWTFADGNGNSTTAQQTVIVDDVTNPTISCVANQTINLGEGQTFYTVQGTELDPTSTDDNCGVASVVNDFNSGSTLAGATLPEGTTTIIWTVADNAGNTQTCSFDVIVDTYVGISDFIESGMSIYPNPTSSMINIDFANKNVKKITVSDLTGKQILERKTCNQSLNIDFSEYSNGVYLINLQTEKEVFTCKIIKN